MSLESVFRLSVIVNMIDNLSGPTAKINQQLDRTVGKVDRLQSSFSKMTKEGLGMTVLGKELASAALSPVESTFETRKALGELASVGVENLKALEKAGKDFSDTWAGTSKAQFITAAYDIKSGISSLSDTAVAEYTRIAGVTAKGTKSSVEQMTDLFATGYGIYKDYYKQMSDIEFGNMFSAGISTTVENFKTTGSKVASSIESLGAAATAANVPLEEQLSVLGMLGMTMSGSEAGTKYKAFLRSAAKAGDKLGLSFVDANNQLRSTPEIIEELRSSYGETIDAMEQMEIQKAFGTDEAVAMVMQLYDKSELLQGSIVDTYGAMSEGIDIASGMASPINSSEGEQYVRLQQSIHNVKEEIGNQLLPAYTRMLNVGFRILSWVSGFIDKHQNLVKWLMIVTLAFGSILVVVGAFNLLIGGVGLLITSTVGSITKLSAGLRFASGMFETMQIRALYAGDAVKAGFIKMKTFSKGAITGIRKVGKSILTMSKNAVVNGARALKNMALGMVRMAKQAVITAVQAMPKLIASVWSFTSALLANPVTWIVIGIVALIAALFLLWKNWDKVSKFVSEKWSAAMTSLGNGFNWIKGKAAAFGGWISGLGSRIGNKIKTSITNFGSTMKQSGSRIMETFTSGIKSAIHKPVDMVKGALKRVRKLLPFSDAKEGPLSTLTLSGKRVFETINSGMVKTMHLPYETTEKAFGDVELSQREFSEYDFSIDTRKVEKVSFKEFVKESIQESDSKKNDSSDDDEKSLIQYFIDMKVDFKTIKELPDLLRLLEDIKQYNNKTVEA